jgi:hypothetical protein
MQNVAVENSNQAEFHSPLKLRYGLSAPFATALYSDSGLEKYETAGILNDRLDGATSNPPSPSPLLHSKTVCRNVNQDVTTS